MTDHTRAMLEEAVSLIPDDIELYRIMKAPGRSRRQYTLAINAALEPCRGALAAIMKAKNDE